MSGGPLHAYGDFRVANSKAPPTQCPARLPGHYGSAANACEPKLTEEV